MRVLLADGHPQLLEAIRGFLEPHLNVVQCVDNGESLFEAAMMLQPDVIVTDISMPKLSGIEAAKRLRESGCPSKVVFLAAYGDPDVVRAALKTGALAYVLKISIDTDLLLAIQEAIEGRVFISSSDADPQPTN